MALSERQLLDDLSRTPFVDSTELARILGEPHTTVHRTLAELLADGIVGRVSHGTAHLPSSQRYHLTANGIRQATGVLGFDTPSDFVRAYPVSKEWLTLLIRRMDAVASVYRLAASLSPGIDGLRSRVEFHRRGRFDAAITLHDGRSFGVVRQGLALRRRSLYDRLRAIAQYSYGRRPGTVLILVPSAWELRRTARFCINNDLRDCYVAVESRDALERRDLRLWCEPTGLFGLTYYTLETVSAHGSPGGRRSTASPERKRASIPRPERITQAAPAFGVSPSEKRTLDLITDHPMIPREHLARWLGVSEGRVSQMMRSLVDRCGLVQRSGKRGDVRYTLSAEGIRYVTYRDRAQLPTTQGIWSTALTTDRHGRRRHLGHRTDTWARQTKHADGVTWFLSKLANEARADRSFRWGEAAISPDAVGEITTGGLHIPFFFEYELRSRHPKGVVARLRPYIRYYHHPDQPRNDLPPFPTTLFVVDREDVNLCHNGCQDETDEHPAAGVLHPDIAEGRHTGTVMAPPVGAGITPHGPVRIERLRLGFAPQSDGSCRVTRTGADTSPSPHYAE